MTDKPREYFITEFKNVCDTWLPLHAYLSLEMATRDAGMRGRVVSVVDAQSFNEMKSAYDRAVAEREKQDFTLKTTVAGYLADKTISESEIFNLRAENDQLRAEVERDSKLERERDAYAKAMAIALREGVFLRKAEVMQAIEEILKEWIGANE